KLIDFALEVGQFSLDGRNVDGAHLRPHPRRKLEGVRSLVRGVEGALQRPGAASQRGELSNGIGGQVRKGRSLNNADFVRTERHLKLYQDLKHGAGRDGQHGKKHARVIATDERSRPLVSKNAPFRHGAHTESTLRSERPGQAGAE